MDIKRGKLALIILLLAATDLAVLLDIPFLRQFLGFLSLTILPGLLILYLLKLDKIGLTEKVVLSIGLSISFLMLFGLFINSAYPLVGYVTPLSAISVLISFNVILLILTIIAYVLNKTASFANLSDFKLDTKEKAFLLLPVFFPLLSILGMRLMNITDNNIILMILLSVIPAYVILIAVKRHVVPERIYPVILFLISISVILLMGLRSNHIIGRDTHREYYLFQMISNNQYWQILDRTPLDSCLSITLLPTIYQSFLNIDPEFLFKILYPILFAISALVVFIISKKYIGTHYSFLASFFFISQQYFLRTTALPRINLAILFFILAIMVLFCDDLTGVAKRGLFIIFAASCILSHYSTTYIFFFLLLFTWLGGEILPLIVSRKGKTAVLAASNRRGITSSIVALFFVMLFLWYSQVIETPFSSGIGFIQNSFVSLHQVFLFESRAEQVSEAFGHGSTFSLIPVKVKFVFNWLTIILIAIGVLSAFVRYKRMVSIADSGDKTSFLQSKIDAEYFILSLVCIALLVLSIVVPHVSHRYGMARVYFQMIGILAMFFIIGGITIAKFLKLRPECLILLILIPFFLCNTGMVDQMFNQPILLLNSEGAEYEHYYIHDQESYAAKWLKNNGELENNRINADGSAVDWLMSQGGISPGVCTHSLLQRDKSIDGYIYLGYYNVVNEEFIYAHIGKSKIYTNGGSEVYE
jgi:uncharacterized membrane protein